MPTMSNLNVTLTVEQVLGSPVVCLVGQRLLKEYQDGKVTDKVIGARFEVVSPAKCFEHFSVKIEGAQLLDITDEAIAEACATLNPIFVKFSGFAGKLYNGGYNNAVNISCSATGIEIVPQKKRGEHLE